MVSTRSRICIGLDVQHLSTTRSMAPFPFRSTWIAFLGRIPDTLVVVLVVSLERPRHLSSMVWLVFWVCNDTSPVQARCLRRPDSSKDRGGDGWDPRPSTFVVSDAPGGSYPVSRPGSGCVAHVRRLEIRFDPRAPSTRIVPRTPCRLTGRRPSDASRWRETHPFPRNLPVPPPPPSDPMLAPYGRRPRAPRSPSFLPLGWGGCGGDLGSSDGSPRFVRTRWSSEGDEWRGTKAWRRWRTRSTSTWTHPTPNAGFQPHKGRRGRKECGWTSWT